MSYQIQNLFFILGFYILYTYYGNFVKNFISRRTHAGPSTINIFVNTIWIVICFGLITINTIAQGEARLGYN